MPRAARAIPDELLLAHLGDRQKLSDELWIIPPQVGMLLGRSQDQLDETRAIALVKAGALFVPYGPDGWLGERVETMPALVALMESMDLSQVTCAVFGSEPIRKRL